MKTRMAIELSIAAGLIMTVASWLRGHNILTAVALWGLFLLVTVKVGFAFIARTERGLPPGGGGGWQPPDAPVPRPPGG